MLNATRLQLKHHFSYLQQFMVSPEPWAHWHLPPNGSARLCCTRFEWTQALTVAELGAADGVLTKRILGRMRADAQLDAYEIQTSFVHKLQQIDDGRLRVMAYSAERLERDYDVIFSCLPLLSIPLRIRVRILQQAQQRLRANNGTLVLFQYSHLSEKLLSRYFHWQRRLEVRNFPPALVYVCTPR